jgi:hypothetical protein
VVDAGEDALVKVMMSSPEAPEAGEASISDTSRRRNRTNCMIRCQGLVGAVVGVLA